MSKEEIVVFHCDCDECERIFKKGNDEVFPYDEGWIFVYNVNLQKFNKKFSGNVQRIEKTDLHFCSKKCCTDYLGDLVDRNDIL